MLPAHEQVNFRQHQRQIHEQPCRVEVDFQQAPGGVGPQQEHQQQRQEAGQRDAPRPHPQNEQVIQNQVQHRARQHGVQRAGGALIHHIHAVQKLVQAGTHGAQRQKRHQLPGVKVALLEHVHQRLAQPDDARHAAEQHAGVNAEHLGEKRLPVLLLGDGGQLPRLVEKGSDHRNNLRQEVSCGQKPHIIRTAVAVVALAHGLHKEQVRGVDDPEADGRRNHGHTVEQHLLPQGGVELFGAEEPSAPPPHKDEHRRNRVGTGVGQQKAGGAHPEHRQKQQVKAQQAGGGQHAVQRHQTVEHPGADELGTQGAQAAHEHAQVQQPQIRRSSGDVPQQRRGQHHDAEAQQNGDKAVDKHAGLVLGFIQPEPDDRVADAKADHGDEQVGGLLQQAGHAHHIGGIQRVAQVGTDEKAQQLGAEIGNGEQQGVAHQLFVFSA